MRTLKIAFAQEVSLVYVLKGGFGTAQARTGNRCPPNCAFLSESKDFSLKSRGQHRLELATDVHQTVLFFLNRKTFA